MRSIINSALESYMLLLGNIEEDKDLFEVDDMPVLRIVVPVATTEDVLYVPMPDVCKDCLALVAIYSGEKIGFVRVREISKLK